MQIAVITGTGEIIFTNKSWNDFVILNGGRYSSLDKVNYFNVCEDAVGIEKNQADKVSFGIKQVIAGTLDSFSEVYPCHAPNEKRWFKLFVTPYKNGAIVCHSDLSTEGASGLPIAGVERFYGIIHDLKTPLNIIMGYTSLLELDELMVTKARNIEYLNSIQKASDILLSDIHSLLKIDNRVENLLENDDIKLSDYVSDMLLEVDPLIQKKRLSCNIEIRDDLVLSVPQKTLRSILMNLISNAIKYNKVQGEIFIAANHNKGCGVNIDIKDTGIGISPASLPSIFHTFNRGNSTDKGVEGAGVGLSNVYREVVSLGGGVTVKSIENKGSNFTVTLPERSLSK